MQNGNAVPMQVVSWADFWLPNVYLSEHTYMQTQTQTGINYMNYIILHQNIFPVLCDSTYLANALRSV